MRPRPSATSTRRCSQLDLAAVGAARRVSSSRPTALDPIKHPRRGRPPAQRSARRDGRERTRSPPRPGRAAEVGAAADARSATRSRRSAATTSTRCSNVLLERRTRTSRAIRPNVLGATPAGAQHALYRGGLKIYTNYDPTLQYRGDLVDDANVVPQNQTQFTAALVVDRQLRRRRARDRVRPHVRRRPVRSRDRRSRSPGRFVVQEHHARGRARRRLLARTTGVERQPAAAGGSARVRASDSFYNLSGDCHGGDATRSRRRSRSPTTARSCAPSSRSAPATTAPTASQTVIQTWRSRWASTRRTSSPVVSTTLGTQRRAPARDGAGLLGDRRTTACCTRREFVTKIVDRNGKMLYQAPTTRHAGARPERRPHRDPDAQGRPALRDRDLSRPESRPR